MLLGTLGNDSIDTYDRETCLKPASDKPNYLVIGDSYASGAYLLLSLAYPEIHFGQLTVPGCRLIVPEKIIWPKCKVLFKTILSSPEIKNHYQGIIFTSNWVYLNLPDLEVMVSSLEKLNLDLVMIGQLIRFNTKVPNIILSSLSKEEATSKANRQLLEMQYKLNSILSKKYSARLKFVDLISLQCLENECDIFDSDGNILYLDDSHFSTEGTKVMAMRLRDKYPDLLISIPESNPN